MSHRPDTLTAPHNAQSKIALSNMALRTSPSDDPPDSPRRRPPTPNALPQPSEAPVTVTDPEHRPPVEGGVTVPRPRPAAPAIAPPSAVPELALQPLLHDLVATVFAPSSA